MIEESHDEITSETKQSTLQSPISQDSLKIVIPEPITVVATPSDDSETNGVPHESIITVTPVKETQTTQQQTTSTKSRKAKILRTLHGKRVKSEHDPVERKHTRIMKQFRKLYRHMRHGTVGRPVTKVYDLEKEDITQVKLLVVDLIQGFIFCGSPAFRVEHYITQIAGYYGITCHLDATMNGFIITFISSVDQSADTRYIKVKSPGNNMTKLCMLDDIADDIRLKRLAIHDARAKVKDIMALPPVYAHMIFTYFAYTISAIFTVVLQFCPWPEVIASIPIGLWTSTVVYFTPRLYPQLGQITHVLSTFGGGLLCLIFEAIYSKYEIPFSINPVLIPSIFLLLPGLALANTFSDLNRLQFKSGLIRLFSSLTASSQIAACLMVIGLIEKSIHFPQLERKTFDYPWWSHVLIVPCGAASFMVATKAPVYPLSIIFTLMGGYASVFVTRAVGDASGRTDLGTFCGAFSMSIIAKVYGWLSRHPSSVVGNASVLFIVAGGWSVKGINAFFNGDATTGSQFLFQCFAFCIALALGKLIANLLVPLSHKHKIIKLGEITRFLSKV
jgi:uncharacterized membrane protein YjjP (DUF1212 family)